MYESAEKFVTDLGFEPMTDHFWNKSIFEKPNDGRDIVW